MSIRQTLSSSVDRLSRSAATGAVQSKVQDVKEVFETSVSLPFKSVGDTKGGFQQLTNTLSDVVNDIEGSVPNEVVEKLEIVKMTDGVSSSLRKDASDIRTDVTTIVGDERLSADGFLEVAISSGFPEALAAVTKKTTDLRPEQITDLVRQNNFNNDHDDTIENIVKNVFPASSSQTNMLKSTGSLINNNLQQILSKADEGFNSLVENIVETNFKPAYKLLNETAFKNNQKVSLPIGPIKDIIRLQQSGDIKKAAVLLKKYSDLSLEELESKVQNINNTASSNVTEAIERRDIKVERTDVFINQWREGNTPSDSLVFNPVIGKELTTEVLNMTREVTEIIVIFLEGSGATVNDYHQAYVDKYNIGFNPHFYIGKDGIVYRGRPLEIEFLESTPLVTNDHYKRSIVISVNIDEKSVIHKVTTKQTQKLIQIIKQFLIAKPGLQVFGAKDVGWEYNVNNDALDIPVLIQSSLGKRNAPGYDPLMNAPLTSQQLAMINLTNSRIDGQL